MKNFLSSMSKGILYFIGGMLFTFFLIMVVVVVMLYTETGRLRNEIDNLKAPRAIQEMPQPTPTKTESKFPENQVEETPETRLSQTITKGIRWGNWNNLKTNLTENEVVKLLGNPTQIISLIDTTKYIYKDGGSEGYIEFNRKMRVVSWKRL